ncbi:MULTISPECIES: CD3337/EF1877 family mobilome membrane protein [Thermoactinomyces]|jgi:hypothetical protein|uniref:Type IV secretion system protein n=1 Tax=Thermoactinomyces daqus TaxID=1329516 RepID=A0A7W1X8N2_9BACL|nr:MULTISPECIES: type IV secretion system protein [Thermoactinomyces]MBA4542148.1 type IV secretion system protein [Thermoactinomyces daqus]MBH8598991.1 type IV secretion system protein [Thermoactinomyces sp. CICC 10523]MBH8608417.1 type IV secretion system protein [Thermoactinomyces sp. CICC 10521]
MNLRKRKWGAVIALVLAMAMTVNAGVVFAADSTSQSSDGYSLISDLLTIFPQDEIKKARAQGYDVKFAKYFPSQYKLEIYTEDASFLDIDKNVSNGAYTLMNEVNNFIWQALLSWNFTVILVVENAFSLNVVDQFATAVQKAVQQLAGFTGTGYGSQGLMGNFLLLMIILAGAYIAYKGMIKKKTTEALNGMLTTIAVLILGLVFFANAGGVMRYFNDISSGLSQEVMGVGLDFQSELSGNQVTYPADVSSMVIADKLYNMMVYEPYIMLQYAKTSSDQQMTPERVNKILAHQPGSEARKQAVMQEAKGDPAAGIKPNPMVTTDGVFQRLTLLLLLCVAHFILGLLFFIIAGAMIVYQFMFVLTALFAPFAFLMALYPAWSSVAVNWFKRFVGYQLIKLIIGIFFSMLLTISQFLYQMSPPQKVGYVWTIAMQLILVVGVIWKRNELFSIMKVPVGKVENFTGELNIKMPMDYVNKYTTNLRSKVGKIKFRR